MRAHEFIVEEDDDLDEGNAENAKALVGSGKADSNGKKTNSDSADHKAVRTPGTGPESRTKSNNGAPPGANPGFTGG